MEFLICPAVYYGFNRLPYNKKRKPHHKKNSFYNYYFLFTPANTSTRYTGSIFDKATESRFRMLI
jgi:hypothetical protein